jgi:hypothetical protein
VDSLFVESIEAVSIAGFLPKEDKSPWIRQAIRKIDTLKVFLHILWEVKSLNDKKYIALSIKIDEVGRMLGGWMGQIQKHLESKFKISHPTALQVNKTLPPKQERNEESGEQRTRHDSRDSTDCRGSPNSC